MNNLVFKPFDVQDHMIYMGAEGNASIAHMDTADEVQVKLDGKVLEGMTIITDDNGVSFTFYDEDDGSITDFNLKDVTPALGVFIAQHMDMDNMTSEGFVALGFVKLKV